MDETKNGTNGPVLNFYQSAFAKATADAGRSGGEVINIEHLVRLLEAINHLGKQ